VKMKILKPFTISVVLVLAFLAAGGMVSGSPLAAGLAQSGITYVNGIFASGTGAVAMTSTHYQMLGTLGEVGLPYDTTTLHSASFEHQPGFLVGSDSWPVFLPLVQR
jgi:hypothetical protein